MRVSRTRSSAWTSSRQIGLIGRRGRSDELLLPMRFLLLRVAIVDFYFSG